MENWMALRGLLLVTEMDGRLHLFDHDSAHIRAFMVRALNFVAELSFGLWGHAVMAYNDEHAEFWGELDTDALISIGDQEYNADPVVRDAAADADFDRELRAVWVERRKEQARLRRVRQERLLARLLML
jgi:hypothetical protein